MSETRTYVVRTMFSVPPPRETRNPELTPPERSRLRAAYCQEIAAQIRDRDERQRNRPPIVVETRTPQIALVLEVPASSALGAIQTASERFRVLVPFQHREALVRARRKD